MSKLVTWIDQYTAKTSHCKSIGISNRIYTCLKLVKFGKMASLVTSRALLPRMNISISCEIHISFLSLTFSLLYINDATNRNYQFVSRVEWLRKYHNICIIENGSPATPAFYILYPDSDGARVWQNVFDVCNILIMKQTPHMERASGKSGCLSSERDLLLHITGWGFSYSK